MKHTRWPASGPSTHATKLLKNRHQRFYRNRIKGRKEHDLSGRLTGSTPFPVTAEQATEAPTDFVVSIALLGKIVMKLHAPNGLVRTVPLDLNPKTIQLLAYLAWKRGAAVRRHDLIIAIWDTEEEATDKKLGWVFNDARKALRAAVTKAVEAWNEERGERLLDPKDSNLDIFRHKNQMWWLSSLCRVVDLEAVERQHRIISEAKKRGELINTVPDYIRDACYTLIAAYAGDFLENNLGKFLDARAYYLLSGLLPAGRLVRG